MKLVGSLQEKEPESPKPAPTRKRKREDPKLLIAIVLKEGTDAFKSLAKEQKPLVPFAAIQRGKVARSSMQTHLCFEDNTLQWQLVKEALSQMHL